MSLLYEQDKYKWFWSQDENDSIWENESDRDKMMSYLYGQLVQPNLKIGESNRFFDVTEL